MKLDEFSKYEPVIVGAMGGSGTRIVSKFLQDCGVYMGKDLNESEDAMYFVEFYDKWINLFFNSNRVPISMTEMQNEFRTSFEKYLQDYDSGKIGWKNPRSIHLIGFFNDLFPRMKFIQVIRDGRDVAYSKTQVQVDAHAYKLLGDQILGQSKSVVSGMLWQFCNLYADLYCKINMKERYLCLRYEDLCESPKNVFKEIASFAKVKISSNKLRSHIDIIKNFVDEKGTIGRYKGRDSFEVSILESRISEGLKYFGYI